ncbi:MAG: hypothetical protein DRO05_03695 [Thermoproteota archaeon]|nr:MAG: hypothetical protein DRO05_03695 [Candidatus Korarchaeota archaeon]
MLSVETAENEEGAIAGVLAGLIAAYYGYPHVGVVFGMEFPDLWNFEGGYKWGVDWAVNWTIKNHPELANKGICATPRRERVLWTYTGTFTDVTKGYEAAKAMYEKGAAVVYNVAGGTGIGISVALKEIAEREGLEMGPPFWIGVDADQDWILPGFTIASTIARFDLAVYYGAKLAMEGKFRDAVQETGGKLTFRLATKVAGLEFTGLSLSTLDDLDEFIQMGIEAEKILGKKVLPMPPDEIKSKVKAMRESIPGWIWDVVNDFQEKIRTGEIVVPVFESEEAINKVRATYG